MNPHISGYDEILGKSCTAKFEHVHRLYSLEKGKSLKIACDLKKASLNPSSLARTSPQHALGKFYQTSEILWLDVFITVFYMTLIDNSNSNYILQSSAEHKVITMHKDL